MSWQLTYSQRVARDLRGLNPTIARRVANALQRLAETGRGDLDRLQGQDQEWRLRVGAWRVRLTLDHRTNTIHVYRVLHRREAYRR